MIRLDTSKRPGQGCLDVLSELQAQIDALPSHSERSARAKQRFSGTNKKGNKTFDEVKLVLTSICQGARRCAYCEDSVGDEVEHIYPKNHYPKRCFVWDNYLYACGNCNGPKNDLFAVYTDPGGRLVRHAEPGWPEDSEPPVGETVMIDPRTEDPMDFAVLDLLSTFCFTAIDDQDARIVERFQYTYEEVLRLNSREFLIRARKSAFDAYWDKLFRYVHRRNGAAPAAELDAIKASFASTGHRTVWEEMKRYHREGWLAQAHPALDALFHQAPETLDW
jgi:5-methylcytosine-specific restriction endonuclease McrA